MPEDFWEKLTGGYYSDSSYASDFEEYHLTPKGALAVHAHNDIFAGLPNEQKDILVYLDKMVNSSVMEIGMDLKMPEVEKEIDSLVRKGLLEKME